MKNSFFFYIIPMLAMAWLLPACRKPDRDSVSGKVLEYGTEKPVSGAVVKLFGWSGSPLSGGNAYLVDSTTTNSKGEYHFGDDAKFALSMTINSYAPNYFTDYQSETVVADGKYDNTTISLKPYAWLKIRAINKNGVYSYFEGPGRGLSGIPVIEWVNLNDTLQYINVVRGNIEQSFLFSIWDVPGGMFLSDMSLVQFFSNSDKIELKSLQYQFPRITPIGLDTTNITIIF